MPCLLEVSARAVPGREAEFDRWYEDIYMPEVLGLPGSEACERSKGVSIDGTSPAEFVAIYEAETGDPAALLQSLIAAAPPCRCPMHSTSPSMVRVSAAAWAGPHRHWLNAGPIRVKLSYAGRDGMFWPSAPSRNTPT